MEVPEADAVVEEFRRRLDPRQAEGVPAHVTVLYPFVPAESVDAQLLRELTAVFAAVAPFRARFSRCAWFGTDVLWLAPDDDQPFRVLTAAAAAAYPEHPPYGGEFDDPIPHLTSPIEPTWRRCTRPSGSSRRCSRSRPTSPP